MSTKLSDHSGQITDNIPGSKRTPSAWVVSDSLQDSVNKYIAQDAGKYRRAQDFGDFLLDHPQFSQVDTFRVDQTDLNGNELLVQETLKAIVHQGLVEEDLADYEVECLRLKFGENWRKVFQE